MTMQDSLIAYYALQEASGQALDSHGANHLTRNNGIGQAVGFHSRYAAAFTAASLHYFSIADNAALSTGDIDFTGAVRFRLTSKAAEMGIVSKWVTGSNNREYILLFNSGLDRFAFGVSSAGTVFDLYVTADTLGSPVVNTWYSVVFWHDSVANTINIQANGGAVDSAAYALGVFNGVAPFEIGRYDAANYLDGRVERYAFAKKAWSAAERSAWHAGFAHPFTTVQWPVSVDLNGDGDYDDDNEALTDYVMALDFQNGFSQQFSPIGRDNTATLTLRNDTQRFSPEHASVFSANWTRSRQIRIQQIDPAGPTVDTMYTGWIDSIAPDPGSRASRRCTVYCTSYLQRVQSAEAFVAIQESKRANEVVEAVIAASGIYPPGISGRWMLGIPGRSEIGVTTYLGEAADWLIAESGITVFNYIGDQWGDETSIYSALRDTLAREAGRLWINRDGKMEFRNRHSLILDTTSDATFDNTMRLLAYSFGDDVHNRVTVRFRTREVGDAPEVLSRIDRAVKISAGNPTKTIKFRYRDLTGGGARIGGRNAIPPVANTDYTANSAEGGGGSDLTASMTAKIAIESATGTDVQFTLTGGVDAWIQSGAQIRGTAIRDYGQASVTATNDDVNPQPFGYAGEMDNEADAQGMADFILSRDGTPRGKSKTLHIRPLTNAALTTLSQTLGVFSRITAIEDQTGMSADYFIISEKHTVRAKGAYEVIYGIEPANSVQYWVLGVAGFSELGETTWIGPF